ncbi:MAG: Fe-S protein assembly chaperone HscA [Pseudomonadota bacterium]|nr:Fe-S protein assembly chaperone HscA [Pseudomonadota bacterium]
MALMQIAEPGQSPDPHKKTLVLGIDLGTTHSLIASVKNGTPVCLESADGEKLMPSIVHYTESAVEVGVQTEKTKGVDVLSIASIKRFIGRSAKEVQQLLEAFPVDYEWDFTDAAVPKVKTPQGLKTPVEISAEILKTLKKRAVQHFGVDEINSQNADSFKVVITVPAYFDDAQRQATQDAARLAGLSVLRLINEPTAASLAYGVEQDGTYLVYDFGGGTFDCSLIELNGDVYEVVATAGDTFLGGDDIDHALSEWFLATHLDGQKTKNLRSILKDAKERLSSQESVSVMDFTITRNDLTQVMEPILARTYKCIQRLLQDGRKSVKEVNQVLLVGGSTRSPQVFDGITAICQQQPRNDVNPDEVVALGALAQARKMTSKDVNHLLLDVCPLSLGLETMGGIVEKIIPRNTPIPVTKEQIFTTMKNNQSALKLHVVQGERESVEDCRSLAQFELRDIPPMAAGVARIKVRFDMDANGVLKVSAEELSTHHVASIDVKPSQGLSEEQLLELLQAGQASAGEDINARLDKGARIELQRIIESCDHAFAEDASLLEDADQAAFAEQLKQAKALAEDAAATREDLKAMRESLNAVSEKLAALRMDKAIQDALKGTYI